MAVKWSAFSNIKVATDLDGVLCENPDMKRVRDFKYYGAFLATAKPRDIPDFTLQAIITGRSCRYRTETEKWLKKNNVAYKKLIMIPKGSICPEEIARFKARAYLTSAADVFFESSPIEAEIISHLTEKTVVCVED